MTRKKQPLSLKNLSIEGLGHIVNHFIENCISLGSTNPNSKAAQLLGEYLFGNAPWNLIDDITLEIVHVISSYFLANEDDDIIKLFNHIFKFSPQSIGFLKSVLKVLLHPRLERLDISYCSFFLEVLEKNLNCLSGLKFLKLYYSDVEVNSVCREKILVSILHSVNNIVELQLFRICTNDMLFAVAQNCGKLRILDIGCCDLVTDIGALVLVQCKELREINMRETSITYRSVVQLLCKLPFLESLALDNELDSVLENIPDAMVFNIRKVKVIGLTDTQMQLLVKYCPKLQHLDLDFNKHMTNINILENLKDLKVIVLYAFNFYSHNVNFVLEKIGESIHALHFRDCSEINVSVLNCIGIFCPNIKILELYCEYIDGSLDGTEYNSREPTFKNIQYLYCKSLINISAFEFLLTNCTSIEHVFFEDVMDATDITISSILAKNPMKNLKGFSIYFSEYLTMNAIRFLITSCENLQTFGHLTFWESITDDERRNLQNELKNENIDLDIIDYEYPEPFIPWIFMLPEE